MGSVGQCKRHGKGKGATLLSVLGRGVMERMGCPLGDVMGTRYDQVVWCARTDGVPVLEGTLDLRQGCVLGGLWGAVGRRLGHVHKARAH